MGRIPYKWLVAAVFVTAAFMDLLDTTTMNVALPTLAREFDASVSEIEWVVTGYLLALAVFMPASGWLGDRFGTKRIFLLALVFFTGASALCGTAGSLTELTVFRILQGVGGGMLLPVGTAMLFRAFPPIERARASTVLVIPVVIAPALGPLIGGWLVTYHSWRWIFYLNVPIGIVGFVVGAVFLREHREPDAGRFDVPGFLLSGAGLAAILFALSRGASEGWTAPDVVVPAVFGLCALAALLWVEAHVDEPMLAFRLFRERMFRNANVVAFFAFGSFVGSLFLVPIFLQDLHGLTAMQSGLATFPQAIGLVITSQIAGRLYHTVGPRRLMVTGLTVASLVSLAFVVIDLDTSLWVIRAVMFLRGVGLGATLVPIQAATYANVAPEDTGRASSIFAALRQFASALGVAIIATVFVEASTHLAADATTSAAMEDAALDAYHIAFLVGAAMLMVAALSALLIRDRDAASTMRRYAGAIPRVEREPSPEDIIGVD